MKRRERAALVQFARLLTALIAAALSCAGFLCSCAPVPPPVSPGEHTASSAPPAAGGAGNTAPAQPAAAAPATFDLRSEPTIDVGLAWDLDDIHISLIAQHASVSGPDGHAIDRAGAIQCSIEGGHGLWQSSGGGNAHGTLAAADTLWIGPATGTRDSTGRWNGKTWRGTLKIFVNPRGKLSIASRLPLETYLLGVVPGEIGALDDQLIEAGKAQAVAARSYTLFYRGRRAAEGFDLYATVEDQMYVPVASERPLATRCVEATHGEVALSRGFPIRANYCSTCGGVTAEVWEAWPADAQPYLTSHADRGATDWCAGSAQYRWREEWKAAEFVANVERYAPPQGVPLPQDGLGDLVDVRVDERSRSGRVWRLVVVGSAGSITIPAYSIRQVLRRAGNSASILRSNLFKIDVRRDPATRAALAVVASGAGSGHGVGLCQTGALGMARAGVKADAILTHYYAGVDLERRY
jgi:SpoIID/LytB domain protein